MLPWPYVPFAVSEVTFVTVGTAVSIMKFLLAPSDPVCPGTGNVSMAFRVE